MNPMMSALKGRRVHEAPSQESAPDKGIDLEGIVASLSDDEKAQLMEMIAGEGAEPTSESDIIKGKASSGEKAELKQNMMKDQAAEDDEDMVDSDEIAMGMLDSKFKNGGPSKPRNLHERAQMGMAKNLKEKGKI